MKCEIDIIIDRKFRWHLKDMLSKKGLNYKEWFVEFTNDRSIVSFEINGAEEDLLKNLFEFLKDNTSARIILPDGNRINPTKEEFDEFYRVVCKYVVEE